MLNTKSLKIIQYLHLEIRLLEHLYSEGIQGVQYKVLLADNYSDGEENIIPVLTNNILVTESLYGFEKTQRKNTPLKT
jgi:hypothetical protein